jgi:hypothetical protein
VRARCDYDTQAAPPALAEYRMLNVHQLYLEQNADDTEHSINNLHKFGIDDILLE